MRSHWPGGTLHTDRVWTRGDVRPSLQPWPVTGTSTRCNFYFECHGRNCPRGDGIPGMPSVYEEEYAHGMGLSAVRVLWRLLRRLRQRTQTMPLVHRTRGETRDGRAGTHQLHGLDGGEAAKPDGSVRLANPRGSQPRLGRRSCGGRTGRPGERSVGHASRSYELERQPGASQQRRRQRD